MKQEKKNEMNSLVEKGVLPLSYYNCKVEVYPEIKKKEYLNIKYLQRSLPRISSGKMISKIFLP